MEALMLFVSASKKSFSNLLTFRSTLIPEVSGFDLVLHAEKRPKRKKQKVNTGMLLLINFNSTDFELQK